MPDEVKEKKPKAKSKPKPKVKKIKEEKPLLMIEQKVVILVFD
jgi:hypothetical protein